MENARFSLLMLNDDVRLTPQEIAAGWHFCCEFDGLLRKYKDDDYEYNGKIQDGFRCRCDDP